ncbi:MAG: CBS domain-containing protein [Acidimicrobiales bacterium]|nr:CBS domain-containing protein [Acidimicrobiales bacterium]RZV47438.1 MAG: CBS domain-containing protein [Acidimicrobiales bacterium]
MNTGSLRFVVYVVLGIVVGAIVAFLEWITIGVALHGLIESPTWMQILLPIVGFIAVPLLLRQWNDVTPALADAYIRSYHTGQGAEPVKLPKKLFASFITLASGGAVGLEGSAVITGATLGQWTGDRRPDVLGQRNRLVLVVAGAAAGVASLFKAPATGVLFALESPYRRDISRQGLIPSLLAAASAYLTFVLILGDDRLLSFEPSQVTLQDEILAAVLLGFLGAGAARLLVWAYRWAKATGRELPMAVRLPVAAIGTTASLLIVKALVDVPATLGPGAEIVTELVRDNEVALGAIVALFFLRLVVTTSSLSMSGVGGVFIPLVIQGLLLGRAVELIVGADASGLYPVIGLAAVLGAAYRTPLAAVMFVAETTGRAEFVIPALIATAISQALMGDRSVSVGQRGERQGQLERRLDEPASFVMIELEPLKPETTLLEVIDKYGDRPISPAIAVCGDEYVGLLVLHDVAMNILEHGPEACAGDSMREFPAVKETSPALEAALLMNEHDTAAVAVVNEKNIPVGIVSAMSLAGLNSSAIEAATHKGD